ncbi:MAG: chemotaxis protein CheW [Cyclobacteriaceae bacterium]
MSKPSQNTNSLIPEGKSWVDHAEKTQLVHGTQDTIKKEAIVVFQLGDQQYGAPIHDVKEVVNAPDISPIPQTQDYILGVTNVRGSVISIVDAESRVSTSPAKTPNHTAFVLVINSEEFQAGILVKTVPKTVMIEEPSINKSASVLQNLTEDDEFIVGIAKHEDQMIFLVDILKMI